MSFVLLVPVATATADQYVTVQNGSWSNPSTWSDISGLGGGMNSVPGPSDEAMITTNVTLPGATEVGAVGLHAGGSLDLEGNTLTVDGDFGLGDNALATLQSSGSPGTVSVGAQLGVENASVSDVNVNVASSNGSSPSTVFDADSTWSGSSLTQTGGISTLGPGQVDGLAPTFDGVVVGVPGPSIFAAGVTLSGSGSLNFVPAGAGAANSPALLQLGSLAASGTQTVNTYWYGYVSGAPADGDIVNLVSTTSGTPAGLTATSDADTTYATNGDVLSATYAGPVAPVIGSQPQDALVAPGANASFTATATGSTSVQWQISTDDGSSWTNDTSDSGTTTDTLSVDAVTAAQSGDEFRAVFTNGSSSTNSKAATLTVAPKLSNTAAPAIASNNATAGQAAPGDTLTCSSGTWSVSATYAYAWQRGGSTISGPAAASTYKVANADLGTKLSCTVTATAGAQSVPAAAPGSIDVPATPTIALVGPPATVTTTSTSASYTLGTGDTVTGCALDGATLPNCASPISLSGYAAGAHSLTVTARNSAGTTATASAAFTAKLTPSLLAIGDGPGQGSGVEVIDTATGQVVAQFSAFDPAFTGGVSIAWGDVNGDGTPDLVVGAGAGGGPEVKVIDGSKLDDVGPNGAIAPAALLADFYAFDPNFTGGVSVAAADFTGDGRADIVVGAGRGGGPQVKVFDGATMTMLRAFFAFDPNFTGGVSVAAAEVGAAHDLVVGAGAGGGPAVGVFDGTTGARLQSFFAFDPNFAGGVSVAVGDPTGSGTPDVVIGGDGHVNVYNVTSAATELENYAPYGQSFTGGVNVAAGSGGYVAAAGQADDSVELFGGISGTALDKFAPIPGATAAPSVAVVLPGSVTSIAKSASTPTVSSASTNGSAATALLSCNGSLGAKCAVNGKLTIASVKAGWTLILAAGHKRRKASRRTPALGTAKITIPAGTSKTITIPLNRTGRRLLAKRHTLKVQLTITESGRTVADRTLTFRAKAPKKRH